MKKWIVMILLAAGLGFAAGWFSRPPKVETKVEEVERVVTKVVKEKVTAPDGTVTERSEETTNRDAVTKSKEKAPSPYTPPKPDWSVEAYYTPKTLSPYPSGAEVGRRILGNLWLTAGYNWHRGDLLIGARWEF